MVRAASVRQAGDIMKYQGIEKDSLLNGDGVRAVLWVSGCSHHCKNCQNPKTWDPESGDIFDETAEKELFSLIDEDYCTGLTLSGGDPMYPTNRIAIYNLLRDFRFRYGISKTVWMYTGYKFEEVKDDKILEYIDVLVDGEYIEEQRNTDRQWVGSENQIIWRKKDGKWVPDAPAYTYDKEVQEMSGCDCQGM